MLLRPRTPHARRHDRTAGLDPRGPGPARRPDAGVRPAARLARSRPHPSPGRRGRIRAGRRRPRRVRPHVPAGRLPHRRRTRRRAGRAGRLVRDRHRRRHRSRVAGTVGPPRRAPAGQGGGRLPRADPRPDPARGSGTGSTPDVQQRVVDYLSPAVGDDTYPRINWVWFRLVVQTFLRSVGGPCSAAEMAEDLATHDTFQRADGWLSDGSDRAYDHYVGWALHLYPILWARMSGAADLAPPRREQRRRAARPVPAATPSTLVGADGSPLLQGRSLIYRFAAAAPFWVGALAEVPSLSPGLLRHAATGIVRHFADHGAPDERGPAHRSAGTDRGRGSPSPTPAPARRTGRARACSASRCRPTIRCGPRRAAAAAGAGRRHAARRPGARLAGLRHPGRRHRPGRQPRHRPRHRGVHASPTRRCTRAWATPPRRLRSWTRAAGPPRWTSPSS